MSSKSNIEHINGKRTKFEDNHEKITNFCATCRNLAVECFENKCMELFSKQLDDKSVQAYNTFANTGKISKTIYKFRSFCYF